MEGIILTRRSVGGTGGTSSPIELTIAPGDTEIIETVDGSSCPFAKWRVSVANMSVLPNSSQYFELSSVHDFDGNVCYNIASKLGDDQSTSVDISVTTGTPNTNIVLALTNNEAYPLDICAVLV